jgi:pimeloyl-ACP methyl ester carboxylesterase
VLLHPSLGRSIEDFDHLMEALTFAGFRCIAIDPRGIGASTGDLRDLTMTTLAHDVLRVAEALSIDDFVAVGHAFGNRVMRTVASVAPDRVAGLALLGAGGRVPGDPEAREAVGRCFDTSLPIDERLAAISTAFFAPSNDPRVWLDGWYPVAKVAQQRALIDSDWTSWWFANDAPLLVVQGLQDRTAPPANGRLLAAERQAPTYLTEIDGAGHALLPEQPERVARAVIEFLRDLPLSSASNAD